MLIKLLKHVSDVPLHMNRGDIKKTAVGLTTNNNYYYFLVPSSPQCLFLVSIMAEETFLET